MNVPIPATPRRALITGITGQIGSYLAESLVARGYEVYGLVRPSSGPAPVHLARVRSKLRLLVGDLTDMASLESAVCVAQPDEIYNLGAQSFVPRSHEEPLETLESTGLGVARLLEAQRRHAPEARFFQASSSELFGDVQESPQSERTAFRPRCPYGVAKWTGHQAIVQYREQFGCFAVSGILFNHESPRRGARFVTQKIARGAARISLGLQDELALGNLAARRDWSDARDVVGAIWAMLQLPEPEDLVLATGTTHSVRDLCEVAFGQVGLDYREFVRVDPEFVRPVEAIQLVGDARRARRRLGLQAPRAFETTIGEMVEAALLRERSRTALEDSSA